VSGSRQFDQLVNLLVCEVEVTPCGLDEGRVEFETADRSILTRGLKRALDTRENEASRGAAFAGGGFVQAAMDILGDIDGGANEVELHDRSIAWRLK